MTELSSRRPLRSLLIATLWAWAAGPLAAGEVLFEEAPPESALDFVHYNGMSGRLYYSEMIGSGGALLDFDGDGDLDLYLVQGEPLDEDSGPPPERPGDRLFRNDASPAAAAAPFRLVDVTERAGIAAAGYGMGVAVADFDGDGRPDLYVARWGSNQLLRNGGDGTFSDVTGWSRSDDRRWSVGAAPIDFDRDGRMDLFVANYVDFTLSTEKPCTSATGARDYCGPQSYDPVPDRLLRNLGGGRFQDVSRPSGIDAVRGAALGVVAGDFDEDGWPDLYVANDGTANRLWINQGDGTFVDEALLRGCAVNADGMAEAGMGVDAADFDNDGDRDIVLGHLSRETNTLYRNDGQGLFRDQTALSGLGAPSWKYTSFGTAWLDFDGDGWLDLAVVNGAVRHIEALVAAGDPYPLHQPNQLFRNLQGRGFAEVAERAAPVFGISEVSRGLAVGDVDNDGDPDLLVVNNNAPARLLLNREGARRSWIGLRLLAEESGSEALGAEASVKTGDAPTRRRWVATDGSYASARDPRLRVGLDEAPGDVEVAIRWPSGRRQRIGGLPARRYLTVRGPVSRLGDASAAPAERTR